MRRSICLLALVALVVLARPSHGQSSRLDALERAEVIPGELLIRFQPGRTPEQQAAAVQPHGGAIFSRIPALDVAAVRFERLRAQPSSQATLDLIDALARTPGVLLVEPNYRYALIDAMRTTAPQTTTTVVGLEQQTHLPLVWSADTSAFVPNDPYLYGQYSWHNIRAYGGWALDHHYAGVVAVVDTGVQLDHPDLAAHMLDGYDFVYGDKTPEDGYGHGTHVAGTVAAVTDNGEGVAGACPACLIMPVRVLDEWGYGSAYDVAFGIYYAASQGAQVINLSLGGPYSEIVESSLAYAWDDGAVLVCAAGNSSSSDPFYAFPASDPRCLAVAATTIRDQLAWFSNYGAWVDLAAPGEGIYSTFLDGDYIWASGTSMATPHVAGAAGMLAGAGLSRDEIRQRLVSTADPIAGTGSLFMNGRLNLQRALQGN